jgi:hypothetical protein
MIGGFVLFCLVFKDMGQQNIMLLQISVMFKDASKFAGGGFFFVSDQCAL